MPTHVELDGCYQVEATSARMTGEANVGETLAAEQRVEVLRYGAHVDRMNVIRPINGANKIT